VIHKPALSVTMAACSSPYCQKDPVLACTAESKSLVSAVSKHIIMFVTRLTAFLCVNAGWKVQASTGSCSCNLQRGPVLWCQLCCQHDWSQPDEVHGKLQLCIWLRARLYSTERSAPQLRWCVSYTERQCSSHSLRHLSGLPVQDNDGTGEL